MAASRSGSDNLFPRLVVVVADHSRNLPRSILVLPQVDELSLSDSHFLVPWMMKSVDTRLTHSVSLHVKDLQRSRNQLPRRLPADVVLHGLGYRLLPPCPAAPHV